MEELISVVIPTYNRARYIMDCIENLKKQTYPNFEIIVVDDGSTDGTDKLFEGMKDPLVTYYRFEKNQGACAARNKGVELARADYIAFQDSDDTWDKEKLVKQMKFLKENDYDVCFCSMNRVEDGRIKFTVPDKKVEDEELMNKLIHESYISTQMIFGKKKCFLDEKFDIKMPRYQDYDLMLRIVPKYKVGHLNEALVFQRLVANSISNNWTSFRTAVNILGEKYKSIPGFSYNLYVETGYRNYYAHYGFKSKELFKRALKEQKTLKAIALYIIPDFILGPYVRKKHGDSKK